MPIFDPRDPRLYWNDPKNVAARDAQPKTKASWFRDTPAKQPRDEAQVLAEIRRNARKPTAY